MNYYHFALSDFKSAETMYTYTEEYDVIVVHCQQYLEKAFKHILDLDVSKEIPRTHKLTLLARLINDDELSKHELLYFKLNDCYFDRRYPSHDYIQTSKDECNEIYNETRILKEYIERKYINGTLKRCTSFGD